MPRPKSANKAQKNLAKARRILAGAVARDDSDDELGLEDHPWQYVYAQDGSDVIVGAWMGKFRCGVGDIVLLKAEGSKEAWVGLICEFGDIVFGAEDEGEGEKREMAANFMWFATEKEVNPRNKQKKRMDSLPHELYITPAWDWNPLTTINGTASILSAKSFAENYPSSKIPRSSKEFGKTFLCRRGCNTQNANYTEEFDWEKLYGGVGDIHRLINLVQDRTASTRKRKRDIKADRDYDSLKYVDEDGAAPSTPRKRRKATIATTPRSKPVGYSPSKFTTPTQRRLKKSLEFTPLGTRILSASAKTSSPFQIARTRLHVSSVPTALPCREDAFSTVYSHLEAAIAEGSGSCIYVSGPPGTGKTATIREVVAKLDTAVRSEELDDFIFVEINGMKITEPHQAYVHLWHALRGELVSPAHALDLLEREFSHPNPRRVPCVVLMDELDQLVTKNQSVMYNFFNWPGLKHSRLIVLAVANTMDLPERTLSNKISSRLGLTRITFPGYTHDELIKIIQSRLEGVPGDIVDPDAVQFASRKVAAVSGDARRALDICRRAVEIAETEHLRLDTTQNTPSKTKMASNGEVKTSSRKEGRVTIATIKKAISEATSSPVQQCIRSLPLASKLFLAGLLAKSRRSGVAEIMLGEVIEEVNKLSRISSEPAISDLQVIQGFVTNKRGIFPKEFPTPRTIGLGAAAMELMEAGILSLETSKGERSGKVRLNVGEDEVKLALREDRQVKELGFST